jgi:hypothetical protein
MLGFRALMGHGASGSSVIELPRKTLTGSLLTTMRKRKAACAALKPNQT